MIDREREGEPFVSREKYRATVSAVLALVDSRVIGVARQMANDGGSAVAGDRVIPVSIVQEIIWEEAQKWFDS